MIMQSQTASNRVSAEAIQPAMIQAPMVTPPTVTPGDVSAADAGRARLLRMCQAHLSHRGKANSARLRDNLRAGFTLVEMLVVLVIIGLVMGLVGPRVLNSLSDARSKTAKLQIEALSSSLDLFYLDVGRYPSTSEGLQALVAVPGGTNGWNGPYLKGGTVPADPWGQPYIYRSPAAAAPFEIASFGPAGREGGGTEIKSMGKR